MDFYRSTILVLSIVTIGMIGRNAQAAGPSGTENSKSPEQARSDVFDSIVGFTKATKKSPKGSFETDAEYTRRTMESAAPVSRTFVLVFEPRRLSQPQEGPENGKLTFGYSPDLGAFYVLLPKKNKILIDIFIQEAGSYRAQNAYGAFATVRASTYLHNYLLFSERTFSSIGIDNLVVTTRKDGQLGLVSACDTESYFSNRCEGAILFPADLEFAKKNYENVRFELQIEVDEDESSIETSHDWTTPTISDPTRMEFLVRTIHARPVGIILRDASTGRAIGKYEAGDRTVPGSISADEMLFEPPVVTPEFVPPKAMRRAALTGFVTVEMDIKDGLDRETMERFGIPTSARVVQSACRKVGSDGESAPCGNVEFATKYAMSLRFKARVRYGQEVRRPVVRYKLQF